MRNRLTPWIFAMALAAVPVLAWVQYRWIDRVSDAELQRESNRLRRGLEQVAAGLDAELARAHLWFALSPDEAAAPSGEPSADSVAAAYARRFAQWRSGTEFPGTVRQIRFTLEDEGRTVQPDGSLTAAPVAVPMLPPQGPRRGGPLVELGNELVLLMPVIRGPGGPPGDPLRRPAPGRGFGRRRGGPPPPRAADDEEPLPGDPPPPDRQRQHRRGERLLVLDRDYLVKTVVPALADRYLGRGAYQLRIVEAGRVLAGPANLTHGATVRTLALRADCLLPVEGPGPPPEDDAAALARQEVQLLRQPAQNCPPVPAAASSGLWSVTASTALEASVGAFRTRNLAISFGVLLCLAGAILALWISSSRAAELAQRQMEFAMSVSHELRTPLTVMRLAGDNLAQGVASTPDQVRRYGETIRRESERLGAMLEQVLTFARAQRPDFTVRAQPVSPAQIVHGALAAAEPLLKDAGFEVVREDDPALPDVNADLNLTTTALTNLVVNAVRHAASGKWVRVRATLGNGEVAFEVADHGPGIARRDLRQIFRPFYRGTQSGMAPGTGLGLHLVRRIAQAHGGRVSVESNRGAGTVVTMTLPVAAPHAEEASV